VEPRRDAVSFVVFELIQDLEFDVERMNFEFTENVVVRFHWGYGKIEKAKKNSANEI
jgi:hypothetical protein